MPLTNAERQANYRSRNATTRKKINSLNSDLERVDELLAYVIELIASVENGKHHPKTLMIPKDHIQYARKIINKAISK